MASFGLLDGAVLTLSGLDQEKFSLPATSIGRASGWEFTSCRASSLDRLLETAALTTADVDTISLGAGDLTTSRKEAEVGSVTLAFWRGEQAGLRLSGFGVSDYRIAEMVANMAPTEGPHGLTVDVVSWERVPMLAHAMEGLGLVQYYRPGAKEGPSLPKWQGTILGGGVEVYRAKVEQGAYLVARYPDASTVSMIPPPEYKIDLDRVAALSPSWDLRDVVGS